MNPSPIFGAPLVRAFLRTLLFAAILEALFYRLLTIPAGSTAHPWLLQVHATVNRAGEMMFFIAFLVLLPTLVSIAYATLRHPAWPGPLNSLASIGILTLSALAVSASIGPRGPAFALGFTALALLISLVMLAGFYEKRARTLARLFAVALGGSLICMSLAEAGGLAASLGLVARRPALTAAALSSGWWLLFATGALAFFAFGPEPEEPLPRASLFAACGLSAVTASGVVVGVFLHPELLRRIGPALGTGLGGIVPDVLKTGAAAAALFLVSVTAILGLGRPRLRPASLGLIFLVLAGYPRVVVYQHLLTVLGVVLITGSAPESLPLPRAAGPPLTPPAAGSGWEGGTSTGRIELRLPPRMDE